MRPSLRFLPAVLITLVVATPLFAQRRWPFAPVPPAPCQPCLPAQPGTPGTPGTPTDPNAPAQPDQPSAQNQPQDTGDSGGRGAVLASSSAALPGFGGGFGQRPGVLGG